MNAFLKKRFLAPCAMLLSACGGNANWPLDWTVGTWTEGEYAAATTGDIDECGIVAVLSELESPLQYKLGPKGEDDDTGTEFYNDSDGLSDEQVEASKDNLWALCSQPSEWNGPRFGCGHAIQEIYKPGWKSTLKNQFCPDSTGMSLYSGYSRGLLINANEIFFQHFVQLTCGTQKEIVCNSTFVSRLRPSSGN